MTKLLCWKNFQNEAWHHALTEAGRPIYLQSNFTRSSWGKTTSNRAKTYLWNIFTHFLQEFHRMYMDLAVWKPNSQTLNSARYFQTSKKIIHDFSGQYVHICWKTISMLSRFWVILTTPMSNGLAASPSAWLVNICIACAVDLLVAATVYCNREHTRNYMYGVTAVPKNPTETVFSGGILAKY